MGARDMCREVGDRDDSPFLFQGNTQIRGGVIHCSSERIAVEGARLGRVERV